MADTTRAARCACLDLETVHVLASGVRGRCSALGCDCPGYRPSPAAARAEPLRGRLLTPGEVAALFRVDPKTVTRWAAAGRIGSVRTPGGHRRYRESEVQALLEGSSTPRGDQ